MLKLGIDDAGRGPVIGPMVLAGCLIDEETEKEFKALGVKDSKKLTEKRREFLAEIIRQKAITFEVVIIHPEEIDSKNLEGVNLNEVEGFACSRIINKINKGFGEIKIVIDCPSTNITNWTNFVKSKVQDMSNLNLVCEHKADVNHIAVSAASIIAKSTREKEMATLKEKYGHEIGSGYSSDPLTARFLANNLKKYDGDGIFRKSWATWKTANGNASQSKLG